MSDQKLSYCSFCSTHKDLVPKLIVSDDVAICSTCVDLCSQLILEDSEAEKSTPNVKIVDAYSIKKYLDKHAIGQDHAKMVLSVAIANHYKRIHYTVNGLKNVEIDKGNVLMLGPTGSGKTLLAKTVAKYLDVPFVIADATNLTEAGYVGEDVEAMITMLIAAADGDISRAEKGIVFIDEIDKIARKGESTSVTRDVSGEGVQQALLRLIEGTNCRVNAKGNRRKHPDSEMIEVNTKNILFIAGGAFVGLDKIITDRLHGSAIGFGALVKSKTETAGINLVTPDDLTKFGMIPEFVGRFTTTVTLDQLNKDELFKVLTTIKNNHVDQYAFLFSLDGVTLTFTKDALEEIVDRCITLKTGARGLHSELERALMPHMFHVSEYVKNGITELTITVEMVKNPVSLLP